MSINKQTSFYSELENPKNITDQTYQIWRDIVGTEIRHYLGPNMFTNVRSDVMRNKTQRQK